MTIPRTHPVWIDSTLTASQRNEMWAARNDGWDNAQAWNASRYIEQLERQLKERDIELQQAQGRLVKAMNMILDREKS